MTSSATSVDVPLDKISPESTGVSVMLVARELGLGGIERDVTKLALGFDRRRYVPYVATYKPWGPRYEELRSAGVPILHLKFPSLLSFAAISAALELRSWIRKRRIQVMHAFDPSSVFAVPLARLLGVPVVLSSQLGHRELHDRRTRGQLKLVDRLSDRVVVNCKALQRHLNNDYGVSEEKIELCYNGVDTRQFYPAPLVRLPELMGASLVVGTACVLRPEKGLDLLLTAFAHVRHMIPGMKLLIVGDGPELNRLQTQRDELSLEESCIILPAVSSVAPIMHSIDIFVSSSRSEAFSNAILEAMACGCCVVGSRVGGTPELLGEDDRGLLFESGSAADLSSKLSALIGNGPLRLSLGRRASDFARQNLSVEKNIERTCEIYDTLLAGKQAPH